MERAVLENLVIVFRLLDRGVLFKKKIVEQNSKYWSTELEAFPF